MDNQVPSPSSQRIRDLWASGSLWGNHHASYVRAASRWSEFIDVNQCFRDEQQRKGYVWYCRPELPHAAAFLS